MTSRTASDPGSVRVGAVTEWPQKLTFAHDRSCFILLAANTRHDKARGFHPPGFLQLSAPDATVTGVSGGEAASTHTHTATLSLTAIKKNTG